MNFKMLHLLKTEKYTGIILDIINKVRKFETCCRRKLEYGEGQAKKR